MTNPPIEPVREVGGQPAPGTMPKPVPEVVYQVRKDWSDERPRLLTFPVVSRYKDGRVKVRTRSYHEILNVAHTTPAEAWQAYERETLEALKRKRQEVAECEHDLAVAREELAKLGTRAPGGLNP